MAWRLAAVLPAGWFGDTTPVRDRLLAGFAVGFSASWTFLQALIGQSRINTVSGTFLDLASTDFFDGGLPRFPGETDGGFRSRVVQELLRPRGTRAALSLAMQQLTGRVPVIFEPSQTNDTGGYSIGGIGYGVGGGWGSLLLPYQFFLTVFRPSGGGIAELAGYATGGVPVYGSLQMERDVISDSVLQAAVPGLLPAATTAWMRIAD